MTNDDEQLPIADVAVYVNGFTVWIKPNEWTYVAFTRTRRQRQLFVGETEVFAWTPMRWWRRAWVRIRGVAR